MNAIQAENRPERLLGPAVGIFVTIRRGVCPIHGVLLQECPGGLGLLARTPWTPPTAPSSIFPVPEPLEA